MRLRNLNKSLVLVLILTPSLTLADFCQKGEKIQKIGTAGSWANLRNKEGSLRFETGSILKKSIDFISTEKKLHISTTPNQFTEGSDDESYCAERFTETKKSPLRYHPEPFNNLDDVNDWIKDFSQGSGKEGSDLYNKCDRTCSPQYNYEISKLENSKLDVKAFVFCGPPRDKDENNYLIKAHCE